MSAYIPQEEFKIPSDWIYRGEGNCNVVLSLPSQRKILRIRKVNKITGILKWLITWLTDIFYWYYGSTATFDELRDLKFYKQIIRPLFGHHFVCDAKAVFLSKRQLTVLERKLEHQRPEHRRRKRLDYGRAALFDDYAFIQTDPLQRQDCYAVEIKPKQGWMSFSERKYPKCIFCMNQYIKKCDGQTQSISSYCPLDLFSGDREKMCKALTSLFFHPQNNLKLFKNGRYSYGQNDDLTHLHNFLIDMFDCEKTDGILEEFGLLLQKSLLTVIDQDEGNKCDKNLFCQWNKIIQSNRTTLPKGCVLEKILSVQMLDVEGTNYYYKVLAGRKKNSDFGYVTRLLKRFNKNDCVKCFLMNLRGDLEIVPYLVSAIAKDCSLMLTFQKIHHPIKSTDSSARVVSTKYGDFLLNVGIFDLYPKPVSTIEKHWKKLDRMMGLCQ